MSSTDKQSDRAAEIAAEMRARSHISEPYDMGRWHRASGTPRAAINGMHTPGHMNHNDWLRGWDAENARPEAVR